jgi:ABC-type Mn2+/Zn2+ transport system permease subunit
MNPILRNILAVLAGFVVGSMVNMGIIMISGYIITPPAGADVTTTGRLEEFHAFVRNRSTFVFPVLAHALGTFVGAYCGCPNRVKP